MALLLLLKKPGDSDILNANCRIMRSLALDPERIGMKNAVLMFHGLEKINQHL